MCNYSCAASSARLRSYESPWGGHRDTAPWLPGLPPARLPPKYPGRAAGRVSRVAFAGSFRAGRAGPARLRTHPRRQPGSDLFPSSLLVAFISLLPVLIFFFSSFFSLPALPRGSDGPRHPFLGQKKPKMTAERRIGALPQSHLPPSCPLGRDKNIPAEVEKGRGEAGRECC